MLEMVHDIVTGDLRGRALVCAPWSECQVGELLEGVVYPGGKVEVKSKGRALLRLSVRQTPGDGVLLHPDLGTHGDDGYWKVLQGSHLDSADAETTLPPEPAEGASAVVIN